MYTIESFQNSTRYFFLFLDVRFKKVIPAFETVTKALTALIEIQPFTSLTRHKDFKIGQKRNPFNPRLTPIKVTHLRENWMGILLHVDKLNSYEKRYAKPEYFFQNSFELYDGKIRTDHLMNPRKYMKCENKKNKKT